MCCFASVVAVLVSLAKPAVQATAVAMLLTFQIVAAGELDLNELIRQHAQASQTQPSEQAAVLVSFSIPTVSLRVLARQAGELGIRMVLRGLVDDSVTVTAAQIFAIDPDQLAIWEIDPRLYEQFDINAVPTLVIWNADDKLIAQGEVSLDYALDFLEQQKTPLAAYAAQLRSRLVDAR